MCNFGNFSTEEAEKYWEKHIGDADAKLNMVSRHMDDAVSLTEGERRTNLIQQFVNDLKELRAEVQTSRQRYDQWKIFRAAIEEDPMLEKEWDKFCMLLRLRDTTGFKDTGKDD